jgi:photosystem II stability/assembly factor-like uncharacterized protein
MRKWLLLMAFLMVFRPAPVSPAGAQAFTAARLENFDLISATQGWALIDGRLYRTGDGADSWHEITPSFDAAAILAVAFADPDRGWAIGIANREGDPVFSIARTLDGGATWQIDSPSLFAPGDVDALAQSAEFLRLDDQTGWLMIKRDTSINFSVGSLFHTGDGGASWERRTIPLGESIYFTDDLNGWTARGDLIYRTRDGACSWERITARASIPSPLRRDPLSARMITAQIGWRREIESACDSKVCTSITRLLRTRDGGRTWERIQLPLSNDGELIQQFSVDKNPVDESVIVFGNTRTMIGQGFDACEIPSLTQMGFWWGGSPYRAVNLYIGGSARACDNTALTASYLTQLNSQGWKFIPTWVGPQAPCTGFSSKFSFDPATAYLQGAAEADSAIAVAITLELADADGSGTVIYYDLE